MWWVMDVFVSEHQSRGSTTAKREVTGIWELIGWGEGLTAGSTRRHKAKPGNPIGESITKTR